MTLPIVLSVPHAGLSIPDDLLEQCLLTPEQIAKDGDEQAAGIYDLAARVALFVTTPIARAFLDMNRAPDDFRKDGVVKTHTCWDEPIYSQPLSPSQIERLLQEHADYHRRLTDAAARDDVILGIDCHTMNAAGPPIGPDPGSPRPHVCLSDCDGKSLPPGWMSCIAECCRAEFGAKNVSVNEPFHGGYVTGRHFAEMPWLQLELSRGDFLPVDEKRQRALNAVTAAVAELGV